MPIKVLPTHPNFKCPERAFGTSAGYDCFSVEDVTIPARGSAHVPLGFKLQIDNGWYVEFASKSGLGINKRVETFNGVIDAGYSGELDCLMLNHSDEDVFLPIGSKVVQLLEREMPLRAYERLPLTTSEQYAAYEEHSKRKRGGFGSTDKDVK